MSGIETESVTRENIQAEIPGRELNFPKHAHFKYPSELYKKLTETKRNPKTIALLTFKLGALADRGYIFQKISGVAPMQLEVADFPPYPAKTGNSDLVFGVDSRIIKFLSSTSWLLSGDKFGDVSETDVRDWFLRAETLRQRFFEHEENRKLLMITDGTITFDLSPKGIDDMWRVGNLPSLRYPHLWDNTLSMPYDPTNPSDPGPLPTSPLRK